MVYGIGRDHKLEKNRKQVGNTTDTSSSPSTPSYSYDKLNENTDINIKIYINCRDRFYHNLSLDDKPSVIIQNECASNPYSTDMLI